jgi:hypothetical protein
VALYTDTNYQGDCAILDIGAYSNLGSLSTSFLDNVKSIQIGSATTALLYPDVDFGGDFELLQDGDSDLSNNTIGTMNTASIKVLDRVNPPEAPVLTLPDTITTATDLTLAWTTVAGEQTSSTLSGPDGYAQSLDWQETGTWKVGTLAEGTYQWLVQARNLVGTAKITQEFTVTKVTVAPLSHMIDLPDISTSDAVLLTWEVDQGEQNIDHFEIQYRGSGADWTDLADQPGKDERQLTFWGKAGQSYEFRMRAVNSDGTAEEYLTVPETSTLIVDSCVIDGFEGIDPGDDNRNGASIMEIGGTQTHNWCAPANRIDGDGIDHADWVTFTVKAGDSLRFATKPIDLASAALLSLYDTDQKTFIAEARPASVDGSASLDWTAPADGTYYILLTPMNKNINGTNTNYEVSIEVKSTVQPGTLVCGSVAIPALLAGGYAVSKEVKKNKKRLERKAMGR